MAGGLDFMRETEALASGSNGEPPKEMFETKCGASARELYWLMMALWRTNPLLVAERGQAHRTVTSSARAIDVEPGAAVFLEANRAEPS